VDCASAGIDCGDTGGGNDNGFFQRLGE
jgi:hypothetical protein